MSFFLKENSHLTSPGTDNIEDLFYKYYRSEPTSTGYQRNIHAINNAISVYDDSGKQICIRNGRRRPVNFHGQL